MEKDLESLNIDDGEEEEEEVQLSIDLNLQKSAYEYCLVGYFLTSSVVHFTVLKSTMANLWPHLRGVQIKDLGGRRYLFKFFHELDVDRVVSGSSWTFNNHLLIIHDCKMVKIQSHSDKFCPIRLNLKSKIMEFGWSITLKAVTRRAITASSVWLQEEGDDASKEENQIWHESWSN
ncbi:hypothetical protein J1N35_013818 [Gossypium stocksii]|uniref:DUF4283 domain-containing protein n=1 Tax=Gossypium stocksii TaxID=47602 RepID=A0A9D3VTD0_9ROSI|nr:hypothetical protein J1N35_013818 [Gossypium stocksii]